MEVILRTGLDHEYSHILAWEQTLLTSNVLFNIRSSNIEIGIPSISACYEICSGYSLCAQLSCW